MAGSVKYLNVASDGGIILPHAVCVFLGVEGGGKVFAEIEDNGRLVLWSREAALERAREIIAKYIPDGRGIVDELIAERRAEAERE